MCEFHRFSEGDRVLVVRGDDDDDDDYSGFAIVVDPCVERSGNMCFTVAGEPTYFDASDDDIWVEVKFEGFDGTETLNQNRVFPVADGVWDVHKIMES